MTQRLFVSVDQDLIASVSLYITQSYFLHDYFHLFYGKIDLFIIM